MAAMTESTTTFTAQNSTLNGHSEWNQVTDSDAVAKEERTSQGAHHLPPLGSLGHPPCVPGPSFSASSEPSESALQIDAPKSPAVISPGDLSSAPLFDRPAPSPHRPLGGPVDAKNVESEISSSSPVTQLGFGEAETPVAPHVATEVAHFVIEALRSTVPTEVSVHGCSATLQSRFASDPHLLESCLKSVVDFFLTADNSSRRSTFHVLNDLVQYDVRFRLPVLRLVLPRIAWVIGTMTDRSSYRKTVAVWRDRRIYPVNVCHAIDRMFEAAEERQKNAAEFEERLRSFVEVARVRAAEDAQLMRSLAVDGSFLGAPASAEVSTNGDNNSASYAAATAAAILAASDAELDRVRRAAQSALTVTQGATDFLSRILMDFKESLASTNVKGMHEILDILQRTNAAFLPLKRFTEADGPTPQSGIQALEVPTMDALAGDACAQSACVAHNAS